MMGDQGFIGGNHVLAVLNGGLTQILGDPVGPADQFNHHINAVISCQGQWIIMPGNGADIDAPVGLFVARRNGGDVDRPASAGGQVAPMVRQQTHQASAHGAETGNADV